MIGDKAIKSIATALKKFMRQMDGRIIKQAEFPLFAVAVHNHCSVSLKLRVHQLDPVAFATLRFVTAFLVKVAAQEQSNAMTPSNIGLTIAASMMEPSSETKGSYALAALVVEQLILHFDDIFGVEASLCHVVLSPALPFKDNSTRSSSTIISDDSDFSTESASHSELCNDTNRSSASMTCLAEEVHVEDRHVDAEKDVYAMK